MPHPSNPDRIDEVTDCFDPFQTNLTELQKANINLQHMNHFWVNGQ